MKQYHVYELFDQTGQIVYIGMSSNPKIRFKTHTKTKPCPGVGCGKFYGREDLDWRIIQTYDSKNEALIAEGARKLELKMPWTEKTFNLQGRKNVESGHLTSVRIFGIQTSQDRISCEYCGKITNRLMNGRWHGDRCKLKP